MRYTLGASIHSRTHSFSNKFTKGRLRARLIQTSAALAALLSTVSLRAQTDPWDRAVQVFLRRDRDLR